MTDVELALSDAVSSPETIRSWSSLRSVGARIVAVGDIDPAKAKAAAANLKLSDPSFSPRATKRWRRRKRVTTA
jgi:hypothetical protein